MPIFTYRCTECSEVDELIISVTARDNNLFWCEKCVRTLPSGVKVSAKMEWVGVETPTLNTKGKYEFHLLSENGARVNVDHHGKRRSDS